MPNNADEKQLRQLESARRIECAVFLLTQEIVQRVARVTLPPRDFGQAFLRGGVGRIDGQDAAEGLLLLIAISQFAIATRQPEVDLLDVRLVIRIQDQGASHVVQTFQGVLPMRLDKLDPRIHVVDQWPGKCLLPQAVEDPPCFVQLIRFDQHVGHQPQEGLILILIGGLDALLQDGYGLVAVPRHQLQLEHRTVHRNA